MDFLTDREISWLSFNERVLELAEDESLPLLERVRFLAIFSSNLDEFFMVRVASLHRKLETGVTARNTAGHTPRELMKEISLKTEALMNRHSQTFHQSILPALEKENVLIVTWDQLDQEERGYVSKLFSDRIFPVLTPLAVDPSHPFPYISGLSLNLAVIVKNSKTSEQFFARVKVPPILSRFIPTNSVGSTRFIPLEEVIAIHLQELFPGMVIEDHYTFRVTRNQDLEIEEEESEDLLLTLEQELLRRRFGPPVRLEIEKGIDKALLQTLAAELAIDKENNISVATPLDLTDLNRIADLDLPHLKFPVFRSRTAQALAEVDVEEPETFFSAIKRGEILLLHPYESFT